VPGYAALVVTKMSGSKDDLQAKALATSVSTDDVDPKCGARSADAGAAADAADLSDDERRNFDRYDVEWAVDCVASDTFLFASITNISEMGIFVRTTEPLESGTRLRLNFSPPGMAAFQMEGTVTWINPLRSDGDNPNPGMGIKFINLTMDQRERLVEVIRTIAYLRDPN
jgi:type IV pilus assembly protein PilZ